MARARVRARTFGALSVPLQRLRSMIALLRVDTTEPTTRHPTRGFYDLSGNSFARALNVRRFISPSRSLEEFLAFERSRREIIVNRPKNADIRSVRYQAAISARAGNEFGEAAKKQYPEDPMCA